MSLDLTKGFMHWFQFPINTFELDEVNKINFFVSLLSVHYYEVSIIMVVWTGVPRDVLDSSFIFDEHVL